jgi:peptidyl-prolyl cis-trans isomerase SurA
MKHKLLISILAAFAGGCAILSSSNPEEDTLFSIDGNPVYADEFIYTYEKNNFNNDSLYHPSDVDEYFELFVNFKLKVAAAKAARLDTSAAFQREFTTYKKQLIKPYLSETKEKERLVEEAYERMKQEVNASHILISVEPDASAADTAMAYEKIEAVRQRTMQGEDFEALAAKLSDDPSAATNKGNMGYFTAFQMVYPFEVAAYSTPIDSISPIVRTRFGYHILKVHNRRPSSGSVKASHIMLRDRNKTIDEATLKRKIYEIHSELEAGSDWNKMCQKYSEDERTKNTGGTLPFLQRGQVNDAAFEEAIFDLEEKGQISAPVRSAFGWHIIKLEEKHGLRPLEEMREELSDRVSQGQRLKYSEKAVLQRLKTDYHFTTNDEAYHYLMDLADTSLLQANWNPDVPDSIMKLTLFNIEGQSFTVAQAIQDIQSQIRPRSGIPSGEYMTDLVDDFSARMLMSYEEQNLIANNREFALLLNEYYEGILLFDIMNRNVWEKAIEDSTGLKAFYNQNKDRYTWGPRVAAAIFQSTSWQVLESVARQLNDPPFLLKELVLESNNDMMENPQIDSLVDMYKQIDKPVIVIESADTSDALLHHFTNMDIADHSVRQVIDSESGLTKVQLLTTAKKSLELLYNQESPLTLHVEEGLFEKADNQLLDTISWKPGDTVFEDKGMLYLVAIDSVLAPTPQELKEIKGVAISHYQDMLEQSWLEKLKQVHKVEINTKTLEQIKSEFTRKLRASA